MRRKVSRRLSCRSCRHLHAFLAAGKPRPHLLHDLPIAAEKVEGESILLAEDRPPARHDVDQPIAPVAVVRAGHDDDLVLPLRPTVWRAGDQRGEAAEVGGRPFDFHLMVTPTEGRRFTSSAIHWRSWPLARSRNS